MVLITADMNIANALKKAEISPNIVPEGFSPSTLLSIRYPKGEDVALGNFIKPSDSAETPNISFVAPDSDAQYTLLLIDPDAPSKQDPKWGPYRHWVVVNIPGSADFMAANQLTSYMGPAPPPKTGDHRYIFLLYKQPSINSNFNALSQDASCFDYKSFVQQNGLELVSVNFFVSRNDDN
ncbi:Phosphatidylethanolamine-binding protein 4 [Rhizopus azygosporus]|uniref:Phosphatidylethanolamine-binding protein 4 n=1 Tax=Rhizopus azygosporus TaxID=86630 RepID=A0A367JP83_RHIAZ|nr:Phosphatidylethanolamine-binding protein 4 [Rhizopus azygosporus]